TVPWTVSAVVHEREDDMQRKHVSNSALVAWLAFSFVITFASCGGGNFPGFPPPPNTSAGVAYAVNISTGASDIYGPKVDLRTGVLTPLGPGFGGVTSPSSIAIEPSAKFAYVSNFTESKISAFAINPNTGALTIVPGSPFPAPGNPVMIAAE